MSSLEFSECRTTLTALGQQLDILATPPLERGWFYIDKKGGVQGPFTTPTMRQWYVASHISPLLRVRFGARAKGPFQKINDLFVPASTAFSDWGNSVSDLKHSVQFMGGTLKQTLRRFSRNNGSWVAVEEQYEEEY